MKECEKYQRSECPFRLACASEIKESEVSEFFFEKVLKSQELMNMKSNTGVGSTFVSGLCIWKEGQKSVRSIFEKLLKSQKKKKVNSNRGVTFIFVWRNCEEVAAEQSLHKSNGRSPD
jgi:hypothetical protein